MEGATPRSMQHPVTRFEVTGNDAARLRGFYSELFGWSVAASDGSDYAEVDTKSPGEGIPGGIGPAKGRPHTIGLVAA